MHKLAKRVGLSASPCARRIRLLERAGIIKGYKAIIDQNKANLPISAFTSVRLERQSEEYLERFPKRDWLAGGR
jgi:Lrp/AsnC family leucine-responsive transcriptional regulator